jgi:hypothetical protein
VTDGKFSICILGSSHTGCMATAWRRRAFPVPNEVSLTFFAARALTLTALELEGRALVPRNKKLRRDITYTSGGKDRIEIDAYDAFVTVALGFSIKLADCCVENGTARHAKWGPVPKLLSRACFEQTVRASMEDNVYLKLVEKIRTVSSAPILNVLKPYPPETVFDEEPLKSSIRMHNRYYLAEVLAHYQTISQDIVAKSGAEILWPPLDTMGLPGFTRPEFAQGALALRSKPRGNNDEDGKHMNEEYGYRVLNAIFKKLNRMTDGRVLTVSRRRRDRALAS